MQRKYSGFVAPSGEQEFTQSYRVYTIGLTHLTCCFM